MSNTIETTLDLPKCACFEPGVIDGRRDTIVIGQLMSGTFMHAMNEFHICPDARQFLFETVLITMATVMATHGTAIETGSQEAMWETERVLKGIEERLLREVRHMYAWALDPKNAEKVKHLRTLAKGEKR